MHTIAGALRADRLWGVSLLISLLALIGVAPFSIFMSEYQLLRAAVGAGAWLTLFLFLAASGVVFVSALRHMINMVFGNPTPHQKHIICERRKSVAYDLRMGWKSAYTVKDGHWIGCG